MFIKKNLSYNFWFTSIKSVVLLCCPLLQVVSPKQFGSAFRSTKFHSSIQLSTILPFSSHCCGPRNPKWPLKSPSKSNDFPLYSFLMMFSTFCCMQLHLLRVLSLLTYRLKQWQFLYYEPCIGHKEHQKNPNLPACIECGCFLCIIPLVLLLSCPSRLSRNRFYCIFMEMCSLVWC